VEEGWLRQPIVFSVATEMRRAEVLNLRWQDVDLPRKLITVRNYDQFRTKSHRDRAVPMSDALHVVLTQKGHCTVSENGFNRRGHQIGASYLSHRFKLYARGAKLDERLHWHSLRHTCVSWLAQDGGVTLCPSEAPGAFQRDCNPDLLAPPARADARDREPHQGAT